MRKVYYGRISTDDQTLASQIDDATKQGIEPDDCYVETASGFKTKPEDREQWRHAMTALRRGGVLYVRWIDRISRNYSDAKRVIGELMDKDVSVVCTLTGLTFDATISDPMQMAQRDGMLAFMAAMGHADYLNRREMQARGIAAALKREPEKYAGRERVHDYGAIREWRAGNGIAGKPASIAQTAAHFGIGTSTVKRAMLAAAVGIGPFPESEGGDAE
ncbi:TPA: recombinase family protein [Burkholderia vietnamiensis]|nr:recombinase family protein [Burkholderia vietnamiensis]